jgi:hypothetical protein
LDVCHTFGCELFTEDIRRFVKDLMICFGKSNKN